MPEGDTIHRHAARFRPLLLGRCLEQLWFAGRVGHPIPQRPEVTSVDALGKHLLIGLGRSALLRVHLGLRGRWSEVPPGSIRRDRAVSVVLATSDVGLVCTRARSVELLGAGLRSAHPILSQLGPDLLAPPVPWDVVLRRARGLGGARAISAVLLDQRVAAGIGNVYRNEVLFLERLHPDTRADHVEDDKIVAMYQRAAVLMAWNLGPGRRITTRDDDGQPRRGWPQTWVYERRGAPCLVCRTPIAGARQREDARPTTFCPRCQPAPADPARETAW